MNTQYSNLGMGLSISLEFYNTRRRNSHKVIDGTDHKRCSTCRVFKMINNFSSTGERAWDGLGYICYTCKKSKALIEKEKYALRFSPEIMAKEERQREENEEYQKYLRAKNKELDEIARKGYDKWYWDSLERNDEALQSVI